MTNFRSAATNYSGDKRNNLDILSVKACKKLREVGFCVLAICALLQVFVESSIQNVSSVIIVFFSSLVVFAVTLRASMVRLAPLPVIIVTGFNMATMSGALVTQTFYLKPLVYNLAVPEYTFPALFLCQAVLLATLLLFVNTGSFFRLSNFLRSSILVPMGLLKAPLIMQIWIMGFFGLAAIILTIDFNHVVKYGEAGPKFLEGFTYLAFAPFILPTLPYFFPGRKQYELIGSHYKYLLPYLVVLVVVGISANTRGGFAGPVANLVLVLFLLFILGQLVFSRAARKWLTAGLLMTVLASSVMSDLATAMVVVRGERGQISNTQLVLKTFDAFQNKKELETYRKIQRDSVGTNDYEENYISNPFLTRLILTKFTDNMLSLAQVRSGRHADALWEVTEKTLMGLFPTPVLRFFGSKLDKEELRFSIGDALYDAQNGTKSGEYKLGSSVAHGIALMGLASYLLVIPMFLVVFVAVQSFTLPSVGWIAISPLILLQLTSLYYLPVSDSFFEPVTFLIRTLPQKIATYIIAFYGAWLIAAALQLVGNPGKKIVKY